MSLCHVKQFGAFLRCTLQHPYGVVVEGICVGLCAHVLLRELAFSQLLEVSAHGLVQVCRVYAFLFKNLLEPRLVTCHCGLKIIYNLVHAGGEALEAFVVVYYFVYLVTLLFIHILEDGLSERLDALCHVPAFVVGNVLRDEVDDPCQFAVVRRQFLYHLVHRQFLHIRVVEPHAQVGCQSQFVGEVAQHALEELVYRLHLEVVEVVDEVGECYACPAAHLGAVHLQFRAHLFCVTVRVGQLFPYTVQLRHYALLHFLRRLVGECHSENPLVGPFGILYHQFYVFHRQAECLAAAGTRVIYFQLHRLINFTCKDNEKI